MSEADDASSKAANLTAVEAISAKLAEVTRLAEKLDAKLCEAGARTQPVPISTSALPISSTLTSTTTTLARISSPIVLTKSTTTTTTTSSITAASIGETIPTFVSSNDFVSTSISANPADAAADVSNLTVSNFGLLSSTTSSSSSSSSSGAIVVSHVEDTKTSSAVSSVPTGSFPSMMASNTSSMITDDVAEKKEIEDVEKLNEESTNEDVNVDGYVTATECSITPTARSRSESFVTTPECEDVVSPIIPTTSPTSAWWKSEEESKDTEIIIPVEIEKSDLSLQSSKMDEEEKPGLLPIGKIVTIEKSTEEKSGKIVKEVTETTTLRVSHDTHLGVASYKVTSNTLEDHRQNVDVKKMQDSNHILIEDENTKLNGIDRDDIDVTSAKKDSSELPKEESKEIPIYSTTSKEVTIDEEKSQIISKETKNVCSITKTYARQHEDSGIEMSPTKRDKDDLDGEEFLENARKSGEWLRLKVLEVQPELTKLGSSVKEATELSNSHNEVLLRLQSKQSPVEELLRQADQLISTQRPRAEIYAAMAETLGQAWRDVNDLLERRKQILDCNVLFQCRAEECGESMKALEMACNDHLLPIEIDAVKNFLSKIHDLRKTMLEALMGALQEGKTLLDKLKEIANEGTLDSRPDKIKIDADHAVLKVERWLEDLHDKRRLIEASFRSRKTQLEQCLALALLATDLRDLEEILNDRISALSSSCDQLGDTSSSAELLLFELKKLQTEAKEFQDRSIKITKSTERLVSSGHFAGEQATEQAYAILGAAADYVNDLDQYETLLNRAVAFFEAARSAITKLDQLEIQLVTTEHPPFSTRLARFHGQMVNTIEDVTSKPLMEGYALLDITGRGAPGAEGVRRTVEELENRKIRLLQRCTANEEENLEISRMINIFLEKYEELHVWLTNIAEAFLQGHQDMGSDLPMAKDFYKLHDQLLNDLDKRNNEVEHLEFEILPIRERLDESQKHEFHTKIIELQNSWAKTKNIVARRVDLGYLYVQFHEIVEELRNKIELFDNNLENCTEESKIDDLMNKWKTIQSIYLKLSNSGKVFLDEAAKINDPYLDVTRACLCVQTLLEIFANRQLTITESWEKWQTTIKILKERRIEHERKIEESTKTLEWVSKFGEQLYPVITCQSIRIDSILRDLEGSKRRILPELNKAVDELDSRIKSIDNLVEKGEMHVDQQIKEKLSQMYEKLHTTAKNYKDLLTSLISIFENLHEVEHKIEESKTKVDHVTSFSKSYDVDSVLNDFETNKRTITESLKHIQTEIEIIIGKIKLLEPPEAALQDIDKLRLALDNVVSPFQTFTVQTLTRIEEHRRICIFSEDLSRIDSDLRDLNEQLQTVDARFNENLQAAKTAANAFNQFEATMTMLEQRIDVFVRTTEKTIVISTPHVRNDLTSLKERWRDLKSRMENIKKRMVLCIQYFELLEEAKEWYREGGKLLIVIARKATSVKVPKDAMDLLQEIENYLKPGEQNQDNRIERLKELSTLTFGIDRLPQFNEIIVENRQMLDSFAVISSELRTLIQNLQNAEDLREKLRIEKLEADEKLHAVKKEMAAAEAARLEAENARKIAEKLAVETLERAEIEANRLKEEQLAKIEAQKVSTPTPTPPPPMSFSVSAQTDKFDGADEKYIHETHTSAVTKKEIHILEKMKIEKIVPIVQKEPSPPKQMIVEESHKTMVYETEEKVSPEFTIPLNDATVQEGERFTFECRLIGYPIPEVVWYKDGISILNNPDYLTTFHQGICTLTIEETFAEDSAKFTCKAFNNFGSAETSATLTVKETAPEEQPSPPVFIKELKQSTAIEGNSYRLECTVEGNPLPTVQWYKNETNIDNSPDYIITYNNGEACMSFDEVFLDDKGIYTCKATNRLGQVSTSAVLDVKSIETSTEKPYFLIPLSNAMARAGQRVKLECEATGNPMPQLFWTHDGKPIDETTHTKIQTESGRTSLIISEAFPKDAGCYTVTAKNDIGEASVSCNVSVKGLLRRETSDSEFACSDMEPTEPKIQLRLKDHEVFEGHSVRLDCVIVGQPEPEVIWYHNDKPVKESVDFQLLFQGDKCSLIIHEAYVDDAGVYKVVAINSGGETSSQCTLKVLPIARNLEEADAKDKEIPVSSSPSSPPKFVKLPTDSLVAEGEDASFECAVTGEPKPEVKWYFDNNEIKTDNRILIKEKEDGTITLKILSTIPEDKGNYVVKATNISGEAKAFARLVVRSLTDFRKKEEFVKMEEKLIAPSFKERFINRFVPEGVSTKFECIVVGKPVPKIQWLFNDRPVHGKDFLVSVSGDRQVLTIPETESSHAGTISCVAENTAGKATCNAKLEIGIEPKREEEGTERLLQLVEIKPVEDMHASSSSDKHFTAEKMSDETGLSGSQILTKMSQTITESKTTHTSTKKEFISSMMSSSMGTPGQEPTSVTVKSTVHSTEQSTSENNAPPVVQSQKIEEFEKIIQDQPGEIRQEKTVVVSQGEEGIKRDGKTAQVQKPSRKSTAPRFVSPLTGMIVDQGADIILEGIVDGYPQPNISWSKNGQELQAKDGAKTSYTHNHVRLELKNVNVKNAGRYTCTANNEVGSASSTADLVVKKTIFPPVFGRRLQAQVVKRGDRVIMEVEITGTPEPTVTWYKDDIPIKEQPPSLRIRQQGNCYILQIDKAEKTHAGKYMVRAINAGGEAQSIADFAVFEPTPDTMTEVHKTVIYENVQDKKIIQPDVKKVDDVPSATTTLKTEQITGMTTIQPSSILKTIPTPSPAPITTTPILPSSLSTIRKTEVIDEIPEMKTCRSEKISSTFESHQTETKSEQKFHMKLEHKTPPIIEPKARPELTTTVKKVVQEDFTSKLIEPPSVATVEEQTKIENENIETSTIAKKDALSFFESITKESETVPKGPKEMIKLIDDSDGKGHEVKVGKLTQSYERSTGYQEIKKPEPKPMDFQTTKKSVQDIFTKLEHGSSTRGVDNKLFDFPYSDYKSPLLDTKKTIMEDITISSSPIESSASMFTRLETKSESSETMMKGFTLVPEPPPEIGYMPKPDEIKKKSPEVPIKAKQLQESFEKTLSPIDAPIGGVKIFPTVPQKVIESPKIVKKPSTMPPPPFELDKKEVVEEVCIKKDVHEKKDSSKMLKEEKIESPKFVSVPSYIRPVSPARPWSSSSDVETRSHVSTDISEYRCHSAASSHQEILRSISPRPSVDGLAMEKSWAKKNTEATRKSWPPQPPTPSDTTPTLIKQFPGEDYKTSTKEFKQETEQTPDGGVKKTSIESSSSLEKHSWSSKQESMEKIVEKAPSPSKVVPPIIYKAETIKVDHAINTIQEQSMREKYSSECDVQKQSSSEKIVEEYSLKSPWSVGTDLKAPGLVKSVEPPKKIYVPPTQESSKKMTESYSYDSVILEPGPPPEIGYVPPPMVKEKKIEMSVETKPAKIPPSTIKTIPSSVLQKKEESPPVLPPKDVKMTPPPLPAKQQSSLDNLEPFPFKPSPSPTQTKPVTKVVPPVTTPTKFVKGTFGSDYESDMDIHVKPKWRPYESDSEEPRYRRVQAPVSKQTVRPRSTEPEPLPPSKFDTPPVEFSGPSKSMLTEESQQKMYKKTTFKRHERETTKQQQQQPKYQPPIQPQTPPIVLKPGSPPIYVQPSTISKPQPPKSPPTKKPESPKFKVKTFQQESGYMADTDEPLQQKASNITIQKSFGKHDGSTSSTSSSHMESRTSYSESKSEYFESKSYHSHQQQQKKEISSFVPITTITTPSPSSFPSQKPTPQQRTSFVEKTYSSSSGTEPTKLKTSKETVFTTDHSTHRKMESTRKVQGPSPSPSKFVKGEFRESDYESDYDGRISSVWKPRTTIETDDRSFKPVKPTLTGPGKSKEPIVSTLQPDKIIEKTSTKEQYEQDNRMEDRSMIVTTPTRIKQVLLPGSPPEIAYAPPQGQETYYEARAGMPYHNAIGTETRKTVRMDESTENSRRIVTVEQTSRVIKFGDKQKSSSDLGSSMDDSTKKQQQKSYYRVPTPKKFVQGQFRESDYESDVDSSRIKPKWAPADSDSEDPRYRRVQPPSGKSVRSSSLPVRQEHVVSPLEFDTGPPTPSSTMKRQTSMTQLRDDIRTSKLESTKFQQQPFTRHDESMLQPGSPPEFGFVSRTDVKKAANHVASRHMSDMTSTFKSKTEKFVSDIQSDLKQGKPILKHPAESRVSDGDEPRTYREESRVAEHGMKQIDPDTGLIYFKYDFGYEFGIVLPGEGKKTITSTNKTIQGQRRASDIEVPIVHEFTTKKENGYAKKESSNISSSRATKSTKFGPSKTVKWEPTSESEFSEAEDTKNARRRYPGFGGDNTTMPAPPSLVIPCSPSPSRWDHTTPSPLSLSPSLPSLSPRYSSATGPPSNVDSAGSPWPTSNGVSSAKEVIQPYLEILPKKAPLFITPLRDIAVVSGQTARFECIVQAEPQPNILWSKDGRIIENSTNYEIHYRNGVCRLTIAHAYPDDAGTYACTATNGLGSTVTSSTLQVPGNRRSIYAPI
ncbi:PREDICTED: titin isoform X2 [Polistes dominula]|uniref:Titin isoform X2 n=1 Tax=Polistes dominula TaxID=743375 RepID=A0ABM1HTD6_POLDO|nr:PREDICTED: titin isoform X2 [Polistes dominula]